MNNGKYTRELLGIGETVREGYAKLTESLGKLIAIVCCIIAALVTFTDVTFLGFGTKDVGGVALIMLICSYVIYLSLLRSGETLGKESEEYIAASKKYFAVREKICPEDIGGLRDFCKSYAASELAFRQDMMLSEAGLAREDLSAFLRGEITDKGTRRRLRHISRLKQARITPAILLSRGPVSQKSEISDPKSAKLHTVLCELLPSTFCVIFTASILLSAKGGLGIEGIVEGIVKLAALPIIGARGFISGYFYAKDESSAWLDTKARLLTLYLSEKEATRAEL